MPRVVHFDINVSESEEAIEYYSKVFGWEIVKWSGPTDYWLVDDRAGGRAGDQWRSLQGQRGGVAYRSYRGGRVG